MKRNGMMRRLALLSPLIMVAVGLLLYSFILPARYMKAVHLVEWLFSGPYTILGTLRSADIVLPKLYRIWLTKAVLWLWNAGFLLSLFACGYVLQNRRQPGKEARLVGPALTPRMDAILSAVRTYQGEKTNAFYIMRDGLLHLGSQVDGLDDFGYGSPAILQLEDRLYSLAARLQDQVEGLCRKSSIQQEDIAEPLETMAAMRSLLGQRESALKRK